MSEITAPTLQNRLREIRTRLGKSQQELALAAGIARQTIGGIEAGTYSVSMVVALRIARALGCAVEDLFWLEGDLPTVTAGWAEGSPHTETAQLARVGGRWVAHGLHGESAFRHELLPADGKARDATTFALFDEPEALAQTVLLAGCAPALSLWARSAERWHPGLRVRWLHANSEQAMAMLARGEIHAAGVHFPDDNLPAAARVLGDDTALIELGTWQEGLALAPGNPWGIQTLADLARPGLRLLQREPGAGSRYLLEEALAAAGLNTLPIAGTATGHIAIAQRIAAGEADAGITVEAIARAYGLGFLPLKAVRFELALSRAALPSGPMSALLETLQHRWVRTQLAEVGGYAIGATGSVRFADET